MTVNGLDIRQQGGKEWEKIGPSVHLDVDGTDLTGMKYCMPVREPSRYNNFAGGLVLKNAGHATG